MIHERVPTQDKWAPVSHTATGFLKQFLFIFLPFWSHFSLFSHSGIQSTSRISDWQPILYLTLSFQKNSAWDKANIGSYLGFWNSLLSGLPAAPLESILHAVAGRILLRPQWMTVISLLKIITTSSLLLDTIQTLTILWRCFMTWVLGQQLPLWIFSSSRLCSSRSEVLSILLWRDHSSMITLTAPSSHMLLYFFV